MILTCDKREQKERLGKSQGVTSVGNMLDEVYTSTYVYTAIFLFYSLENVKMSGITGED